MIGLMKYTAMVMIGLALILPSIAFAEDDTPTNVAVSCEKIGDAERCITTARIKNTRVMSDDAIVFIMRGDRLFLNELPNTCRGLAKGGNFTRPTYRSSRNKMCSGDIFNPYLGGTCRFGSFQEIKLIVSEAQGESGD